MEQRDIVVKVKRGDVLRRFVAHVSGDSMDLNMSNLKAKVIHFFKLKEDADLLLTYTDIDGDVVALSSDDELYDAAIFQRLNPLRITIHVNGDTTKNDASNNSRNPPTSSSLPGLEFLPPQVSLAVEESLRNMPEPVLSTMTKISEEVSKAAAASPVMNEVKGFLANLGKLHNLHTPGNSSPSQKDMGGPSIPKDTNVSSNPEVANVSSKSAAPVDLLSDLTLPAPEKLLRSTLGKEQIKTGNKAEAQKADARDKGKFVAATSSFSGPIIDHQQHIGPSSEPSTDIPVADLEEGNKKSCESSVPPSNFRGIIENGFISNQQASSVPPVGRQYCGWNFTSEFGRRGPPRPHDGWIPVSHRGVGCNACGMLPIVGPRYKSKRQDNYDLCTVCFSEIGNEMDYSRMDHPTYHPPRSFSGYCAPPHQVHHSFRNWGMRHPREKLESRFIHDVTILDGTSIEPSTEFTKIWRLRNSGSTSWPLGTQLVWVSGDVFSEKMAVELEIPSTGFPPSEEIDVAVDFRAPSMPGRYLSYWRLASPHGQKFGQRVWVLIQVEDYRSVWQNGGAPFQSNSNAANSTEGNPIPAVEVHNSNPDSSCVNVELDRTSSDGFSGKNNVPIELVSQAAIPLASGPFIPNMDLPPPYSVTDSSTVTSWPASNPVSFIPYPFVDPIPSGAPPEVNSSALYPVVAPASASSPTKPVASAIPSETILDDATEQALLKDLGELGFKEEKLNREILRNNGYDLEQSVNDLCNAAEWNPVLEGLEEMGFLDKEKNIKLLARNGGSFKQTVLDLLSEKNCH